MSRTPCHGGTHRLAAGLGTTADSASRDDQRKAEVPTPTPLGAHCFRNRPGPRPAHLPSYHRRRAEESNPARRRALCVQSSVRSTPEMLSTEAEDGGPDPHTSRCALLSKQARPPAGSSSKHALSRERARPQVRRSVGAVGGPGLGDAPRVPRDHRPHRQGLRLDRRAQELHARLLRSAPALLRVALVA